MYHSEILPLSFKLRPGHCPCRARRTLPSPMKSTTGPTVAAKLGKLWINRQALTAEDFDAAESSKNEGILDVFPVFRTERMRQKIRCSAEGDLFRGSLVGTNSQHAGIILGIGDSPQQAKSVQVAPEHCLPLLGKLWINRQVLTARDFSSAESFKSGGILDVFPTFETARMEEKLRCSAADDLFRGSLDPWRPENGLSS